MSDPVPNPLLTNTPPTPPPNTPLPDLNLPPLEPSTPPLSTTPIPNSPSLTPSSPSSPSDNLSGSTPTVSDETITSSHPDSQPPSTNNETIEQSDKNDSSSPASNNPPPTPVSPPIDTGEIDPPLAIPATDIPPSPSLASDTSTNPQSNSPTTTTITQEDQTNSTHSPQSPITSAPETQEIPDNLPNLDLPTPVDTSPESPNLTGPTQNQPPTGSQHTSSSSTSDEPTSPSPTPPDNNETTEQSHNDSTPTSPSDNPSPPPITLSDDNKTMEQSNDSPTITDDQPIESSNQNNLPDSPDSTDSSRSQTDTADSTQNPDKLSDLAKRFNINTSKPNFPVNTLRLYYLLLVDSLTQGNQQALDQANNVIPKISILLNTREQLAARSQPDPATELKTCAPHIKAITNIISTPVVDTLINHLFTYIYPLQDQLLISLDRTLQQPSLAEADLLATLKIRAMDSIAYSTILGEIINQHTDSIPGSRSMAEGQAGISRDQESPSPSPINSTPPTDTPPTPSTDNSTIQQFNNSISPIHYQVNLTSQINDVVDAVVYAKQDLEAGTATLIDIVRKIHSDPIEVEKLITGILTTFISKSKSLSLPEPTQSTLTAFNQLLSSVLKSSGSPPAPTT